MRPPDSSRLIIALINQFITLSVYVRRRRRRRGWAGGVKFVNCAQLCLTTPKDPDR